MTPAPSTPWLTDLFRRLTLTALIACVALSLAQLIQAIVPSWNVWLFVGGAVFIALETPVALHFLRTHHLVGLEYLRFRAAEYALFFVGFKLIYLLTLPFATLPAELQNWFRDPRTFLDAQTIVNTLAVILFSFALTDTYNDLETLGEPPTPRELVTPRERLVSRFFWGGGLILITSGLARIPLTTLFDARRPTIPGLVVNVLLYFVLGFLLLGHIQLDALMRQWLTRGLAVSENLPARWTRYTLAFLGLAALAALLIPTRYAFDPLTIVSTIFYTLTAVLLLLIWFMILPINYLISRLLGQPTQPLAPPPVPTPPPSPTAEQLTATGLDFLGSIIFWVIVGSMLMYLLVSFFRDRPEIAQALKQLQVFQLLRRWWSAFRHRLSGLAEAVNLPSLRQIFEQFLARRAPTPFNFFRLNAASPREQVLFYYLSLIRRAREGGFPRRPAQTPTEYAPTLDQHLPESHPEIEALTAAFNEARYSAHPVEPPRLTAVRAAWAQLRAALRQRPPEK